MLPSQRIGLAGLLLGLVGLSGSLHAQGICSIQLGGPAIFCDTFDTPQNGGTRSGDLNPVVWGVSRTAGNVNFGNQANTWALTHLSLCDGTTPTVMAPADVRICNGQVREASNDNITGQTEAGTVTTLAMYPKQPFDWTGRTGTAAFDVSNDSHGTHAAWPEFWVTDTPAPAPFAHFGFWRSFPANALGIRLAGFTDANGNGAGCPEGAGYLGVDSAITITNYVDNDSAATGSLRVHGLDCVRAATGVTQFNHYEVQISQTVIEIYGTDAGTVSPLKHLATIPVSLNFSRGLVWIEDTHYNADKGTLPSQREHTFAWDNVAFDGPFTYTDLSFDALDALTPNVNGSKDLGMLSFPNATVSWNVLRLPLSPSAQAARVLFNLFHYTAPSTVTVTVNGHPHPTAWPFPDTQGVTWRTFAVTIPLTDLIAGTNVVTLGSDQAFVTSNVNLVLVNVSAMPAPVITSALFASGVQGQPFTYQITASHNPSSYDAGPLPAGLAVNQNTGMISGTPTVNGSFSVVLTATNSGGTGSATLNLALSSPPPTCQIVVRVNGATMYLDQASSYCSGAHP